MSDRRVAGTRSTTRSTSETATQRLGRLLDMVPWLLRHQGVSIEEAASEFGLTSAQIESDLELLFVCGTPGYTHAELIDAQWDDGHIYLANADDIAAPMRLTRDEAVTLTAGLQALGSTTSELTSGPWRSCARQRRQPTRVAGRSRWTSTTAASTRS